MSNILTAFNDHFMDFIDDVQRVFPEDSDILTAKNALFLVRKANPKMIVKIWNAYIVSKYKREIEEGNLDFFINKDYSSDVSVAENSDKIMESINRLRDPIKNMGHENQAKVIKYTTTITNK